MREGDCFLIGDVGATKTLLFLARYEKGWPKVVKKEQFLCKNFPSLEEIIEKFLEGKKNVKHAVIGVPGVVELGKSSLTNLSWIVDKKKIQKLLEIQTLILLNDLELLGYGISSLKDEDVATLQKGEQKKEGVKIVLSVGTGLGEAIVIGEKVLATEGGHEDFAATSDEEIAFLQFMKTSLSHVSYERILSGEGIKNVYEFFSKKRDLDPEDIFVEQTPSCKQAVEFFLQTLGKEAGNLALKTLPHGGVYLSGGVLKKNALVLQKPEFLEGFCSKGRFSDLLKTFPVYLIKNDAPLIHGGLKVLLNNI